ncbi:hypothetical protein MMC16_000550 [Acarospora aff. strigata]|nr:hypothetical protein [Acarospora aff. strigata]
MLGWLTGPTPQDDCSTLPEPPETPAPVFAVRAFKTAIFGTPYATDNIELKDARVSGSKHADVKTIPAHPARAVAQTNPDNAQLCHHTLRTKPTLLPSPTKGILLTPGTAAQRRKTVSFGVGVVDDKVFKPSNASQSGLPGDFPGKFPSPWTSKACEQGAQHQTALTKSFCSIRDEKIATRLEGRNVTAAEQVAPLDTDQRDNPKARDAVELDRDQDADITLDVSDPRSHSGQHWKREYEHYEKKTRHEMKKLVKYRRMAKSYAMKKDAEATDLGEKLKTERAKVARMEEEVSRLAAQMVSGPGLNGNSSPEQAQAMKALSKQTALALEYKRKVDQFEAALGHHTRNQGDNDKRGEDLYKASDVERRLTTMSLDLKMGREQLKEMADLRLEMARLCKTASDAAQRATTLDEENISLKANLARLKEEMGQSDIRRTIEKQMQKRTEERLNTENQELKKHLAQSEEQLALLQKTRTKGVVNEETLSADLQHHQRKTLHDLRQAREQASTLRLEMEDMGQRLKKAQAELRRLQRVPKAYDSRIKKDQSVDIWTSGLAGGAGPETPGTANGSRSTDQQDQISSSIEAALSDINGNRSNEHLPRGATKANLISSLKDDSSLVHSRWDPTSESFLPTLPSPEPFVRSVSKTTRARHMTTNSLRQSMLSSVSSPPKFEPMSLPLNTAMVVSAKKTFASRTNIEKDHRRSSVASASGSRANVPLETRTTSTLPPERVAAAKARLAQRNAERKRALEDGKENTLE